MRTDTFSAEAGVRPGWPTRLRHSHRRRQRVPRSRLRWAPPREHEDPGHRKASGDSLCAKSGMVQMSWGDLRATFVGRPLENRGDVQRAEADSWTRTMSTSSEKRRKPATRDRAMCSPATRRTVNCPAARGVGAQTVGDDGARVLVPLPSHGLALPRQPLLGHFGVLDELRQAFVVRELRGPSS